MTDDHVNGTVIGAILSVGQLTYHGRNQGPKLYAHTETELREKAASTKAELIADMGEAAWMIYPDDAWSLTIYQ